MTKISNRHIKAWEKFNDDLEAFAKESDVNEAGEIALYEDAFTTRNVRYFNMTEKGILTWTEDEELNQETMLDEDDAKDWLSFWRGCLRRAKRYWSMDAIELDRLWECETTNDEEDEQ